MIDFSRIGFSPAVGLPLLNPLRSSSGVFEVSAGFDNFVMTNSAMSLIAEGFGTGRTYSRFGFPGMYGAYGLVAPFAGLMAYGAPGPWLFSPYAMLGLIGQLFGPKPIVAGGPSSVAAPQPPPPAPDETGKKGADKTDGAKDAGKAGGTEGTAEGDWKDKVAKGFDVPGVRLAGMDEKGGKKIVRLEPEAEFDPKKSGAKLAGTLKTLHRNGVQTAMIGDQEVATGHRVRPKKAGKAKEAGKPEKSLWERGKEAIGLGGGEKPAILGKPAKGIWIPNTRDILNALQKAGPKTPPASSSSVPGRTTGAAAPSPVLTARAGTAVPAPTSGTSAAAKSTAGTGPVEPVAGAASRTRDDAIAEALGKRVKAVRDMPVVYKRYAKGEPHRIVVRMDKKSSPNVMARVAAALLNANDDVAGSAPRGEGPTRVEVVMNVVDVSNKKMEDMIKKFGKYVDGDFGKMSYIQPVITFYRKA